MHKWVRHCTSSIVLLGLIAFVQSCASGSGGKARIERQAIVDYDIVHVRSNSPAWVEDFYLKRAKNPDLNTLISMVEEVDQKRWLFIVDSGARHDEKVACTMVKAQGREQMAEAIVRKLHKKVQGKPYDTLILGPGLKVAYDILGKALSGKSVLDEFVEGRVFPGTSQIKEVKVFHCALKIEVPFSVIAEITNQIKDMIRKEFYYKSNLERELEGFRLVSLP